MRILLNIVITLVATVLVTAMPEAPAARYGPPAAPQQKYGPPAEIPSSFQQQVQSPPVYGPPAFFGNQRAETIVTKNVYVHVPPEEPESYPRLSSIQTSPPKKHYKIIFIKAPSPPAPIRQVLPPAKQDEHKTLVYVLVKKPEEEQQLLVAPAPSPTEPSKPEVYFIKYKESKKPAQQYGPPTPADNYEPPLVEKF